MTRGGEYPLAQCRVQIIQYLHLRLDAAMGLGVGIAQIPCVFAVLIDNLIAVWIVS